MSVLFKTPDWTAPGSALIDWLDETDRQLEAMDFENLISLVPLVIARSRAIEQLAELLSKGETQPWPRERLTAALARTERLVERIRQSRDNARRELDRLGRDRALAASLSPATPAGARVDVRG